MFEYTCPNCAEEFWGEGYGEDVTCEHCGKVWITDFEENLDSMYSWILGEQS